MKEYTDVCNEVKNLIADSLNIPSVTVTDTSLIADLSADSIQLFELLLAFERAYKVETTYDDVVRLNTVHDVIQYVSRIKYAV